MKEKKKKNKMPWSKKLLIMLFVNFFAIEGFIMWITIHSMGLALAIGAMPDYSPLITFTGAVVGETVAYGIYCAKAKAENVKGGITYDLAMLDNGIPKEEETEEKEDDSVG